MVVICHNMLLLYIITFGFVLVFEFKTLYDYIDIFVFNNNLL